MDQTYSIGQPLIDFTCIYQITDISHGANGDRILHYKPIKGTDKVFTDTIPEKNLGKAGLRHLLTPVAIRDLLRKSPLSPPDYIWDIRQAKEDLYQNNPHAILNHLRFLCPHTSTLDRPSLEIKADMINHLCLEISFVTQKNPNSVIKNIESVIQ